MTRRLRFATAAAAVALGLAPATAWAQGREIVQPLPPPGSDALATALARLARNPRDLAALLDAGDAATLAGDVEAAQGFYARAQAISPGHPRVKLGAARSLLKARRPVDALRFFAEAETAGLAKADMAADRALAFDLVGDNRSAQENYRLAVQAQQGAGPDLARRFAISQAIAGDRAGFEATLLPLLEKGDLAGFRTRAFGLAIMGRESEAISIAQARMPGQVAEQIAPYLRYMPRLTKAQQAAAANFGIFPRAAAIGVDDPEIAAWASANLPATASPAPAAPVRTAAASPRPATVTPAPRPAAPPPPPPPSPPPARKVAAPLPQPATSASVPEPKPHPANVPLTGGQSPAQAGTPVPPVRIVTAPAALPPVTASIPTPPQPVAEKPPEPATLAEAFAEFDLAAPTVSPATSGGVDLTKIAIPREAKPAPAPPPSKAAPPPPPPPPKHPSRFWVQVATGKDRAALAFDWRRMAKKASAQLDKKGPFVAAWGQTSRLLAGPYPSEAAAREALNTLKKAGVDGFTFTSAAGEKVEPLK